MSFSSPRALAGTFLTRHRFAGDLTPPTFRQADMIYDEAFSELRDQMYEGFGAIELMVRSSSSSGTIDGRF